VNFETLIEVSSRKVYETLAHGKEEKLSGIVAKKREM
jgi:hypothetical protein